MDIEWVKSSACSGGTCVECAKTEDKVLVRQSADPEVVISYTADEWRDFVLGVKAGEFDL